MPKLNLEAKNETQKIIKDYLEKNVNDMLAEKINNGVHIQRDGKTLLNKKTLAGCMDFALKEAQKLTEKGARAACIQDSVVFGWAIHYFEEDSIEGTLYYKDGAEYKSPKPVTPPKPVTTYTPPKPQLKPQMSLFELMENNANEEKPSENAQDISQKGVQVYLRRPAVPKPAKAEEKPLVQYDPPAGDGKHWIDEKTYVDDDGLVHNVEESEEDDPAFDMSVYDAEALAKLDEIFGNLLELR